MRTLRKRQTRTISHATNGVITFVLLVLAAQSAAGAATLRGAAAKVEITPPPGIEMWGYSDRKGPATGTLDPLYARVLVLGDGKNFLALVTLDLGRPFGPGSLARLQDLTPKCFSSLIVTASHTHSGPAVMDRYPNGTPAWELAAIDKIGHAIQLACSHLVDVRIGTGYGAADIGHNRLHVNTDGTVNWFERNLTRIPTSPVDPMVSVLRIDQADGTPLAILVNYSCHPVVFGSDNLQYSADYPGVMIKTVEAALGNKLLCFFLQGAPGDINPYYAVTPLQQNAIRMRDWTGERLGREAAGIAKNVQTKADPEAALQFVEHKLKFHSRWDPQKWRDAMVAVFGPSVFQTFPPPAEGELELSITTVLINKRIAIMTMPGEAFVEYQISWRERCPVPDAFFLGYANGYYGYFPTIRSATLGGYGAANPATWVEVGAGDRMVDDAVMSTYDMLGRMRKTPEDVKQ